MRKTIQETTPKPTILQPRLQQGSKTIKKSNILQQMVHEEQDLLLGKEKRHRHTRTTPPHHRQGRVRGDPNRTPQTTPTKIIML